MVMILAHELGHLLTNEAHFGVDYPRNNNSKRTLISILGIRKDVNLMQQGGGSRMPGIGQSCRLETFYQEGLIHETVKFIKSKRDEAQ
jgi:hypothetical protein